MAGCSSDERISRKLRVPLQCYTYGRDRERSIDGETGRKNTVSKTSSCGLWTRESVWFKICVYDIARHHNCGQQQQQQSSADKSGSTALRRLWVGKGEVRPVNVTACTSHEEFAVNAVRATPQLQLGSTRLQEVQRSSDGGLKGGDPRSRP